MSGLFVAADRLKGNPRDPDGIQGLAEVVDAADPARPPYGVEPVLWQQAVEAANDLADRLAGGGDDDGDGFVDDVVDEEGEPVHTDDDLVAAGQRAEEPAPTVRVSGGTAWRVSVAQAGPVGSPRCCWPSSRCGTAGR